MWKPRPRLSFSLQGNSTLLSLRLSGNKIGRGGGLELASMLQENCALQELEVADCDLVDGLQFLKRFGADIILFLRVFSIPTGHQQYYSAHHHAEEKQGSLLCRYQPPTALQPSGANTHQV